MSVNRFMSRCLTPYNFVEASYNLKLIGPMCRNVALCVGPTCQVVVDKIMLGAWPKMPTSTFSQSRRRISSQQKFSVVDL